MANDWNSIIRSGFGIAEDVPEATSINSFSVGTLIVGVSMLMEIAYSEAMKEFAEHQGKLHCPQCGAQLQVTPCESKSQ